ncbi:hypothetical protein RDV89_06475 [Nocardioides zeae]|uniref:Glycosyl transferase family 28 C-terminal domain-containing protein n=1 Tax=Nocardioides imazamoxiresistens TaxID=3231893 RepID=A0ABU3PU16_9ACTN|nr:glycosyltransferase [Nocardioides zeae]MDT9592703.1 hypothetical protein [Nocardioides zeae]
MSASPRLPVVLATSNGVGMGHLTRQLAVALSGEPLDVTLLSLSGAVPTVARAAADGRLPGASRVRFEYCPSRTSPWQGSGPALVAWRTAWDAYFADRLRLLVAETGARVVAYDGVVPYAGLLAARRALPSTAFVWVRRGMWRPGVGADRVALGERFEAVVEPGDLAATSDAGATVGAPGVVRTAPVSLTSAVPPVDRARARAALGLDPDRPALLLAPGSGAYADVSTLVAAVLDQLAHEAPEWQVAVTRQAIARRRDDATGAADDGRVVVLDDVYPLSRHLAAFDAAVGAAGYNAVHEHAAVGLPTLLVPSTAHETDDQVARAHGLARLGAALVADGEGDLERGMRQLLDPDVRVALRDAALLLPAAIGARDVARALLEVGAGRPEPTWPDRVGPPPWRRVVGTPLARRRGRPEVVEDVTGLDARGPQPVEHLVAGSSRRYREQRAAAARWLYA